MVAVGSYQSVGSGQWAVGNKNVMLSLPKHLAWVTILITK